MSRARRAGRRASISTSQPIELLAWVDQMVEERECSRNVVITVALERMRHDIEVYGDVGGLPKPLPARRTDG